MISKKAGIGISQWVWTIVVFAVAGPWIIYFLGLKIGSSDDATIHFYITGKEMLGYWIAYLPSVGTLSLGYIVYKQNERYNSENSELTNSLSTQQIENEKSLKELEIESRAELVASYDRMTEAYNRMLDIEENRNMPVVRIRTGRLESYYSDRDNNIDAQYRKLDEKSKCSASKGNGEGESVFAKATLHLRNSSRISAHRVKVSVITDEYQDIEASFIHEMQLNPEQDMNVPVYLLLRYDKDSKNVFVNESRDKLIGNKMTIELFVRVESFDVNDALYTRFYKVVLESSNTSSAPGYSVRNFKNHKVLINERDDELYKMFG